MKSKLTVSEAISYLEKALVFNPNYLELNSVDRMEASELQRVADYIVPGFCFDNAFYTARKLSAKSIVYGGAINYLGENSILPAEHCWVRLDDQRYIDPTYEKLGQDHIFKVDYYRLFEIPLTDYLSAAEQLGNTCPDIIALNFMLFRKSPAYKKFFRISPLA